MEVISREDAKAAGVNRYFDGDRSGWRRARYCKKVSATSDAGLESTQASGKYLDPATAIELFKAQDNAFDFLGE